MKAHDFRIGNLVNTKYGVKKITQISIDGKSQTDESEPIELTEEILLKCGFKKEANQMEKEIVPFKQFIISFDCGHWFLCDTDVDTSFNFLHQLQNLYYALTGQELEVNI